MKRHWPFLLIISFMGLLVLGPFALAGSFSPAEPHIKSPQVKLPLFHTPQVRKPVSCPKGARVGECEICPGGFRELLYNGEKMCVKCKDGFRYVEYNGVNMCVKCPSSFVYTSYKGRNMCVRCDRGYTYRDGPGGGVCVKCGKGYVYRIHKGRGACDRM